jgi:hypothetical protein
VIRLLCGTCSHCHDTKEKGRGGSDALFVGIGQQAPIQSTRASDGRTQLQFVPIVPELEREREERGQPPLFALKKVQYSQAIGLVTHFKNNFTVAENSIKEQSGIARQV